MTSTADSLSGPWAANLGGGIAMNLLASIVVVMQEIADPLPSASWIFLSVVAQIAVSSLWVAAVAAVSRRRFGRVVPAAAGLLWTGVGVTRGVVGGLVALAAGVDPEWVFRIGFWTIVTLCWMPLLTYALAQWDDHRRLLADRAAAAAELQDALRRATASTEERLDGIARAAADALEPAFDEIRATLRQGAALDPDEVRQIAARLDALAERTAHYSAREPAAERPSRPARVSVTAAANEFELRRPVFATLLTAADTAAVMLPLALHDGGWPAVAEFVVGIVVAGLALAGLFGVMRPFLFSGAVRSVVTRVGVLAAGVIGTLSMLVLPWDHVGPQHHILLAVFPVVVWFAAAATGTAVGLHATNVELAEHVDAERAALAALGERVSVAEAQTAARLETLVRGDVNGLVAGCALALGMLAEGGIPSASRDQVIARVLAQLDAAVAELHAA